MELGGLIADLRSTTKPLEKQTILQEYRRDYDESGFLDYLIASTFDPDTIFNLALNVDELPAPGILDITSMSVEVTELLEFLKQSQRTEENRRRTDVLMRRLGRGSQELLLGTINKDWKAGLGVKQINKAFPGMIRTFEVQLANQWKPDKFYGVQAWLATPKMDGIRCIALRRGDKNWDIRSRTGKALPTAHHLLPYLEELYYATGGIGFFDGELYTPGQKFESIQGNAMRMSHGPSEELQYHVFLCGQANWFTERRDYSFLSPNVLPDVPGPVVPVREWEIKNDPETILQATADMVSEGFEGIMLRPPHRGYKWGRSNDLLKVKLFDATDCTVVAREVGPYLVAEEGQQVMEDMVVSLTVRQPNGLDCGVGSGLTLPQRRDWLRNPDEILFKTVEIQHQGFGTNGRMRFPVFKAIRRDK